MEKAAGFLSRAQAGCSLGVEILHIHQPDYRPLASLHEIMLEMNLQRYRRTNRTRPRSSYCLGKGLTSRGRKRGGRPRSGTVGKWELELTDTRAMMSMFGLD